MSSRKGTIGIVAIIALGLQVFAIIIGMAVIGPSQSTGIGVIGLLMVMCTGLASWAIFEGTSDQNEDNSLNAQEKPKNIEVKDDEADQVVLTDDGELQTKFNPIKTNLKKGG